MRARRLLGWAAAGALAATMTVGAAPAQADPSHFPDNPNACVGWSSTIANSFYDDPDKLRSDQARADDGQPGRADAIYNGIPKCSDAGLSRGVDKG